MIKDDLLRYISLKLLTDEILDCPVQICHRRLEYLLANIRTITTHAAQHLGNFPSEVVDDVHLPLPVDLFLTGVLYVSTLNVVENNAALMSAILETFAYIEYHYHTRSFLHPSCSW